MREETRKGRIFWIFVLALLLLIPICSLIALCLGPFRIAPLRVIEEFLSSQKAGSAQDNVRRVLFYIRLPRILMSLVAGAGLATAGAAFQSLFGNPLATPDTLGVANLAEWEWRSVRCAWDCLPSCWFLHSAKE